MIIKLSFIMFIVGFGAIGLLFKILEKTDDTNDYPSSLRETIITISLLLASIISFVTGIYLI